MIKVSKDGTGVHLNVDVQLHPPETILFKWWKTKIKPKCSHEYRILCNHELIG